MHCKVTWVDLIGNDEYLSEYKEASKSFTGFAMNVYYKPQSPAPETIVRVETQSHKIWERLGQWGPDLVEVFVERLMDTMELNSTIRLMNEEEKGICVTRLRLATRGVGNFKEVLQIN